MRWRSRCGPLISNRTIRVAYLFTPPCSSPRRTILIGWLWSVGPFGPPRGPSDLRSNATVLARSQPFAQNRTPPASSPSSVLALRQRHRQREGGEIVRVQRLVPSSSGQRLCAHLLPVAHRPRWSSFTCSRRPHRSLASQSTRGSRAAALLPLDFLSTRPSSFGFFSSPSSSS